MKFSRLEPNEKFLLCFSVDQCVSHCSAQTCVLAQEEQLLQTGDKQLARHVLLCLLLIVGLFAVNIFSPHVINSLR